MSIAVATSWPEVIAEAQNLRRELHAQPELGWQEWRSAERIRSLLSAMAIPWRECAKTGTVALLAADAPGKHIALRADIDALPIHEQNRFDWISRREGCMHACGHDGHTATLLAATRYLKQREQQLPGPATLLFQPAEEGGHGAREMINDGALEGVAEIYGWHNWPAIPFGKLLCPDDIVMCGNGTFEIQLRGVGGHASQPELCRDPILGASALTQALQQIISRRLAPTRSAVVSVTSINAPSPATVIPETATLGGSIRVPDEASRAEINQLIRDISQHTSAAYGLTCHLTIHDRYQATINHPQPAQRVRSLWQQHFGDDALETLLPSPIMASEDFSYYLREIPGAFALIGADDHDAASPHHHPCHSPHYDFNDRLIPRVAALFCALAGSLLDSQHLTEEPNTS